MVKVIGKDPHAVQYVTCKSCAAQLEYTPSEVQERHGVDYSGGPDGQEWIDCPSCGREVVLRAW